MNGLGSASSSDLQSAVVWIWKFQNPTLPPELPACPSAGFVWWLEPEQHGSRQYPDSHPAAMLFQMQVCVFPPRRAGRSTDEMNAITLSTASA